MLERIASLLKIQPPPPAAPGILLASGVAIPVDTTAGYAPGCIFIDYVGGAVYYNAGTLESCNFDAI